MASGGSGNGDGHDRRMPKDMQGLLRLCAEASDPQNPNENTSFTTMSPERREWLENALEGLSTSPIEEMKKSIGVILDASQDVDNKIEALETLIEWSEHIDFAMDFHKIGGFDTFPVCHGSDEAEMRWKVLELIATLVQNNPYCQAACLPQLPKLLEMLDQDDNSTVKTKALYATSCLIRDHPEGLDLFIKNDGFSYVMRAMQTDIEKLKIKSSFMLTSICQDNDRCKDILCDMGMLDQLIGHLGEEHTAFHEHLMSALLSIVRNHARSVQECLKPEMGLIGLLDQRREELKGKAEYQEELEYIKELTGILTPDSSERGINR